jgi:uncharacterized protein YaiL (DUF2058 family)
MPPGSMRNDASRNRHCATRPRPIARSAQQHNAELRRREIAAQIAQLVRHYRQPREGGDIAYNFADRGVIKKLYVSTRLRDQLIRGQLVIVRSGNGYELVPVACAERIRARDADVDRGVEHPRCRPAGRGRSLQGFPDSRRPDVVRRVPR